MKLQASNLMKTILAFLTATALLAGCSAGGGKSTTTPVPGGTVASDLIVTASKSSLTSSGSDSATITVTAVDANRNIVVGAAVSIVPDANAVLAASAATTGTDGTVTGTLGIGNDHSNRTIDVVVTSGSIKKTLTVQVVGAVLQATVGSAAPGSSATITYHLVDGGGNAIANESVAVTLAGGSATSGTTDANGNYTYTYTVPNTATVAITAIAAGAEADSTVTTTSNTTAPATGTVLSASLSANPSNVQVNSGTSTTNQIAVRALFVGASNAPIQYARVRFDLDGDVNGIGGSLTSANGLVYSDANGVALTSYTPGSRSSGNQALTLRACWSETDFAAGTCPNSVTATVTVVSTGVSLAILTNGKIATNDTQSIYSIAFAVQVVDSVGQPIQGTTVAGSVDLPRYYRGQYLVGTTAWLPSILNVAGSGLVTPQACDNEDINRNDILEVYSNGGVEDANGSGTLEPFKASVAIAPTSTGSDVTDEFGKAYFTLQYGQNYASWEDFVLTFTTTVQGTEGRNTYSANLPVPSSVITDVADLPPFQLSPYNFTPVNATPQAVNTIVVTDPSSGKTGTLCQAQP
jgi:hypothetical protein